MPALAAEERLRAALAASRASDALSGGAAVGPHRSDLAVIHADKGIAAEAASTGEQKALLIAILLAQARLQRAMRGEPPLLLLDEVAAHLDAAAAPRCSRCSPGSTARPGSPAPMPRCSRRCAAPPAFCRVHDGALSETEFDTRTELR